MPRHRLCRGASYLAPRRSQRDPGFLPRRLLGLPATFLFGGPRRSDKPRRVPLVHGDVVVWGGPARLRYHGVLPLAEGRHPGLIPFGGGCRVNLTFRKAG